MEIIAVISNSNMRYSHYKGAKRPIALDSFVGGSYTQVMLGTELQLGNITGAQIRTAIQNYLNALRPETKDIDCVYHQYITQQLDIPVDNNLIMLPIEGIVHALERNAVLHITSVGANQAQYVPVRVGSRLGFDCVIRRYPKGLAFNDYVRREIKIAVNALLEAGRNLPLDVHGSSQLMRTAKRALRVRNNNILRAFDSLRRPGSAMSGLAALPPATGPVVSDAQYKQEYMTRCLALMNKATKRTLRNYVRQNLHTAEGSAFLNIIGHLIDITPEDLIQAFEWALVNDLPIEIWASLYQELPKALDLPKTILYHSATLAQTRSIVDLWPQNLVVDLRRVNANDLPPGAEFIVGRGVITRSASSQWYNREVAPQTGAFDIFSIANQQPTSPVNSNTQMYATAGKGAAIGTDGFVNIEPAFIRPTDISVINAIITACSDIRPSVLAIRNLAQAPIAANRPLYCLILPDAFVRGTYVPLFTEVAEYEAIEKTASITGIAPNFCINTNHHLTADNGFKLKKTETNGILQCSQTDLFGA